jgi:hypothetical protein
MLNYQGASCNLIPSGTTSHLYDIVGPTTSFPSPNPTFLYAVGAGGLIQEFTGTSWSQHFLSGSTNQHLYGAWYSGTSTFAVGTGGAILEFASQSCTAHVHPQGPWTLHHVWGISSQDVFAVGDQEVILHYP